MEQLDLVLGNTLTPLRSCFHFCHSFLLCFCLHAGVCVLWVGRKCRIQISRVEPISPFGLWPECHLLFSVSGHKPQAQLFECSWNMEWFPSHVFSQLINLSLQSQARLSIHHLFWSRAFNLVVRWSLHLVFHRDCCHPTGKLSIWCFNLHFEKQSKD